MSDKSAEVRFPWGKRSALLVVLGYSRLLWLKFYPRQTMATVMRGLEEAFVSFGGVPHELLFDQMKAVVLDDPRATGGRLLDNPEFLRFARHWGFRIRACKPNRAKTRGKVERPVRYLRGNFLYGREFVGDADLDAQRLAWLDTVANARVHGTTGALPRPRFEAEERATLQPLAAHPHRPPVLPAARTTKRTTPRPLSPSGRRRAAPPRRVPGVARPRRGGGRMKPAPSLRDRVRTQIEAAMRSSRLPVVKTLAEFDFSFQPSVKREQLESLHTLALIERKEKLVFLDPPGVGKTHLAISLAIAAAESGRRVYYGTLGDLIASLEEAQTAGRLAQRLKTPIFQALLIVDEIGYLPISRTGAMLFFKVIARRYEHAATVLTSNKGFEEWGEICDDEVIAAALIDRLVHHCHIVNIRGNRYRMRHHAELRSSLHSRGPGERLPQPTAAPAGGLRALRPAPHPSGQFSPVKMRNSIPVLTRHYVCRRSAGFPPPARRC